MDNNRPALLDMVLILGIALLGIAAFLVVLGMFTITIVPTIPDVLTDVPTLYDYDGEGQKILTVADFGMTLGEIESRIAEIKSEIIIIEDQMTLEVKNKRFGAFKDLERQKDILETELAALDFGLFSQPNQRLEIYWFFAYPSLLILFLFIMFAGATYYWEKAFLIFKRGTSIGIVKTSITGMIVIILLPEFWDIFAIHMKQLALYLIDPFGGEPHAVTDRLWCKMGCIVDIDRLMDQDIWNVLLSNPANFGQELLSNALLPLFKTIPTAMLSISLYVIAKVRVLFIMIVLLTIPLWMVFLNVPFMKKHAHDMVSNMIGASVTPIFSALTLFVGLSYLNSQAPLGLEEWITVLAIGIFASLWPVILAPKLSIIASQTTGMIQTAIQSASMMAGTAAAGMASGMAASGALPGTKGLDMSKGAQAKTLLASGITGGIMGGANSITPANIPPDARNNVTNAMNKGLGESAVSGQVAQIDSTNPNMVDPQISNGVMNNTGPMMHGLQGMDSGKEYMKSPQYDTQVQSEVSNLPHSQQEPAMNSIRQADSSNPASANRQI